MLKTLFGHKKQPPSVCISMVIRNPERTLTDLEFSEAYDAMVSYQDKDLAIGVLKYIYQCGRINVVADLRDSTRL